MQKAAATTKKKRNKHAALVVDCFSFEITAIFVLGMVAVLPSSRCEKYRTGIRTMDCDVAKSTSLILRGLVVEAWCGGRPDACIQRVAADA